MRLIFWNERFLARAQGFFGMHGWKPLNLFLSGHFLPKDAENQGAMGKAQGAGEKFSGEFFRVQGGPAGCIKTAKVKGWGRD